MAMKKSFNKSANTKCLAKAIDYEFSFFASQDYEFDLTFGLGVITSNKVGTESNSWSPEEIKKVIHLVNDPAVDLNAGIYNHSQAVEFAKLSKGAFKIRPFVVSSILLDILTYAPREVIDAALKRKDLDFDRHFWLNFNDEDQEEREQPLYGDYLQAMLVRKHYSLNELGNESMAIIDPHRLHAFQRIVLDPRVNLGFTPYRLNYFLSDGVQPLPEISIFGQIRRYHSSDPIAKEIWKMIKLREPNLQGVRLKNLRHDSVSGFLTSNVIH
jgi:hypothetical protein